ncbi:isocitrate lyase/phosphoenolpyruvate mutase family protein [Streptomyces sp. NPDC093598]|uniref:isocitrate lyase/phosphoenolpyruvate mutase family protein n=1 Tax=Streptomyces sp. NPDC093598 TaxID=3366046 RepID=UPI00381AAA7D
MTADPQQKPSSRAVTAFAGLHRAGEPLLLPNAWDHASARALAGQGFPAIGTTSRGAAAAAGLSDGAAATLYSSDGPPVPHLADAGVHRISLGSLLYRRALGAALEAMTDLRAGRAPTGATPSYAVVAGLAARQVY